MTTFSHSHLADSFHYSLTTNYVVVQRSGPGLWALFTLYGQIEKRGVCHLLSVLCNLFAINEANRRVEYRIKVRVRRTFDTCDLNTEDGWR